ncbi:hypothetical protein PVAG01_03499 [Phlyctema vagabunda]|uniref:RING-type domain-containing protein n=1 Tax=Phlyctema vagabunda TaxID=108571 RepID=A0ABR4PLK5_9HELO
MPSTPQAIKFITGTASLQLKEDSMAVKLASNPCAICYDEMGQTATCSPCNHQFDLECIKEWTHATKKKSKFCPVCRTQLHELTYTDEKGEAQRIRYPVTTWKQHPHVFADLIPMHDFCSGFERIEISHKFRYAELTEQELQSLPASHYARAALGPAVPVAGKKFSILLSVVHIPTEEPQQNITWAQVAAGAVQSPPPPPQLPIPRPTVTTHPIDVEVFTVVDHTFLFDADNTEVHRTSECFKTIMASILEACDTIILGQEHHGCIICGRHTDSSWAPVEYLDEFTRHLRSSPRT